MCVYFLLSTEKCQNKTRVLVVCCLMQTSHYSGPSSHSTDSMFTGACAVSSALLSVWISLQWHNSHKTGAINHSFTTEQFGLGNLLTSGIKTRYLRVLIGDGLWIKDEKCWYFRQLWIREKKHGFGLSSLLLMIWPMSMCVQRVIPWTLWALVLFSIKWVMVK